MLIILSFEFLSNELPPLKSSILISAKRITNPKTYHFSEWTPSLIDEMTFLLPLDYLTTHLLQFRFSINF